MLSRGSSNYEPSMVSVVVPVIMSQAWCRVSGVPFLN